MSKRRKKKANSKSDTKANLGSSADIQINYDKWISKITSLVAGTILVAILSFSVFQFNTESEQRIFSDFESIGIFKSAEEPRKSLRFYYLFLFFILFYSYLTIRDVGKRAKRYWEQKSEIGFKLLHLSVLAIFGLNSINLLFRVYYSSATLKIENYLSKVAPSISEILTTWLISFGQWVIVTIASAILGGYFYDLLKPILFKNRQGPDISQK